MVEPPMRSSLSSPRHSTLDPDAAQALKQFVKKNRPLPAAAPEPAYTSEPAKSRGKEPCATAPQALEPGIASLTPALAPAYRKFDIFDNLDEDRVAEFEQLFAEARAASNYDQFKSKSKKVDPNKFTTCSGVHVKDDGGRVLT
mmetsp:Transcript_69024/g.191055  ORF Transcript_69024/g.191055 Transcript_69024/m.191055 type:complete len:143 (+) Transcript_69024:126-554(+)|eukprot:CAMPEP_0179122358 /NCGR_PEP_ID=MMETSP0796-20121207/57746_1 /TAXON_ID=73915 /ORGANISM="Pyrodinium bahamense, Strain pbaha01" /LENGTH=142 /DNA_ID=CAMNT_0020820981 /DNA_START=115 /DNA_END=543 /DNA_ORIENTATION=+